MGMDANVICIGPFSQEIVDCLNYDAEEYGNVRNNYLVTSTLFQCNTSDQSAELAECLGCDSHRFETHRLFKDTIDFERLELMEGVEWYDHCEKLGRLMDHGFICIFQPNA